MSIKTYIPHAGEIERRWYVVDAQGLTLGRMCSQVARVLMGKHKPTYTPNLDTGDFVIVVNAAKVRVTGAKLSQKFYYRHSGYPGGFRSRSLEEQLRRFPDRVIEHAVAGMLPHSRLGNTIIRKLKVFAGPAHHHAAQQPIPLAAPDR